MQLGALVWTTHFVMTLAGLTAGVSAWIFVAHSMRHRARKESTRVRKEASAALACGLAATAAEGSLVGCMLWVRELAPSDLFSPSPVWLLVLIAAGPLPFILAWVLYVTAPRPNSPADRSSADEEPRTPPP